MRVRAAIASGSTDGFAAAVACALASAGAPVATARASARTTRLGFIRLIGSSPFVFGRRGPRALRLSMPGHLHERLGLVREREQEGPALGAVDRAELGLDAQAEQQLRLRQEHAPLQTDAEYVV